MSEGKSIEDVAEGVGEKIESAGEGVPTLGDLADLGQQGEIVVSGDHHGPIPAE